jgi:hypothetical protein
MRRLIAALFVSVAASPSWAQVPAGGEFRVNTYTTGRQIYPRPSMERDGDFIVVWTSAQDGSGDGAYGQRYAASGAPRGGEFRINTYTTGFQGLPHAAVGDRGDFVVAWESAQDGSVASVHARRYDAAGNTIGEEFLVNTFTFGYQYRPHVGRAQDGRFVVSWNSFLADGSNWGVAARRFDASGAPIGDEFVVNTYTTGSQYGAAIAVEANGNFVVVWEDSNFRDGSGLAVMGQRFAASGSRLGGEFQVNTYTTGNQRLASVDVSPAGGFVVAWTSDQGDGSSEGVFARRFDPSGNAIGNDFLVNTQTTGLQWSRFDLVAHDSLGNFVITWGGAQVGGFMEIFGQRFDAAGTRRGAEFHINTYTTGSQVVPGVASDSAGNFVVAWQSGNQDGSDFGVFAQRFGGLGPVSLAVDTPGNGVLEPGEAVDVRPSWRNFSGAPQTFGAGLTNMTGPGGPAYAIVDGTGSYGTVPNGATAPCLDCYAVLVSNPTTRPATHWDASVDENIIPDGQGEHQRWLLHVGNSFETDVPTSNAFYRFIETLLHHGVTSGCSPTQYCPVSATTREQMAVFVLVAKEGTGYVPPACTTPMFTDVPASNPFCRWIEELARRGIVAGCGGGNYCPTSPVTREQMGVFISVTFGLTLYGP